MFLPICTHSILIGIYYKLSCLIIYDKKTYIVKLKFDNNYQL